jgi:outer membrane lipoprotein SlyB
MPNTYDAASIGSYAAAGAAVGGPWGAAIGAGLGVVQTIIGGNKRKQAQAELLNRQIAEEDAARRQLADYTAEVQAANDARRLAGEREVLSDQAEAEARRQARLASVSTDVDISTVSGTERARRRDSFFEGSV